ncbi:alpha/beta hydrolase fold domain-containing protein [Modestobacter sp. I12A-02628]|uniref:Alpha/beta hydrolase n=1 Tax=Goekera deserti TaxID=2497753 RepID=A0A7K3WHX6_9ACTN|nr:alpha/beta hydrolase [Goekera deserti]MPQ96417.1 alpha/beta hydrolase fold domain-containing protein [Goekera deserti]NDI47271.1 alpha/beta hydrolase fold domain-containing protein [Goekera deserti]NEL56101.1 alpha/beta hydrolase [Goekera deserti]
MTPPTDPLDELHPEVRALLPRLAPLLGPPAQAVGLDVARRRFTRLLALGLAGAPDVATSDLDLGGGLRARRYAPAPVGAGTTVVFLHGGGWTVGDVADYDGLTRRIAAGCGAVVLAVDVRRAPEHPFPAAVEDAVRGTRWALDHAAGLGGDPSRVAVAGDSGGGNLAAVVCQQLRDAGGAQPAAQLLLYPNVARGADQPSVAAYGDVPFLTLSDMAWYTRQYVPPGTDLGDPRISPLEGDLAGLPPALVVTAGVDALRDSGRAYAAALAAAGSPAELLDLPGLPHGFAHLVALSSAAERALDDVLARLGRLLTRD